MAVILFFWVGATLGLLMGTRGEGAKVLNSIGIALIGIIGITIPLWISKAVAFAANRYQEMS